jgi:hypothetical protein
MPGPATPSFTARSVGVFNADDLDRPLMNLQGQIAHWSDFSEGDISLPLEEPHMPLATCRNSSTVFVGSLALDRGRSGSG